MPPLKTDVLARPIRSSDEHPGPLPAASPGGAMRTRSVVLTLASTLVVAFAPAAMADEGAGQRTPARSPELSVTDRLDDRRAVVVGDRFYGVSSADGLYPATGWHIRGEMGGLWAPPV